MSTVARPRRSRRKYAIGAGVILLVGYLAALAISWRVPATILPLPAPNGYDDLVRAGKLIAGQEPKLATEVPTKANPNPPSRPWVPADWASVGSYLDANREALAMLRVGLGRESVVPISFGSGYVGSTVPNRRSFHDLARVLVWRARLALHEGRPDEASRDFLDMVRLARATSRGGYSVDAYWGSQIEIGGLRGLGMVKDDLDAATCRQFLATLRDLDVLRESLAVIDARDAAYFEAEFGKFRRSVNVTLDTVFNYRARFAQQANLANTHDELVAVSRLAQLELAIRAHKLETGSEPTTLLALVPSYLPAIPLDPFAGRAPVYRKTPTGHLLYSVGANRVDDGGKPWFSTMATGPTGDLFLDSLNSAHSP